ncbi:MAG: SUMF1/EgtB/PvdO family nonheme iron enzyme [Dysgonamonadaceae bacterium]|jgi:formylglycine-generating enzyme required for sulfatase activity|nr:SUMF1/EgtB/PvdO family nonheme iron enzyme [Dysgonamonadaceae bacterium]
MRTKKIFTVLFIGIFCLQLNAQTRPATAEPTPRQRVTSVTSQLTNDRFFTAAIREIEADNNEARRNQAYQKLYEDANFLYRLQEELSWLNMTATRLAFADMKRSSSYNSAAIQPKMDELERLYVNGFSGIYRMDREAIQNAEKALSLRRDILLSNPLLDEGKIVATRFNLGRNARRAMAPALGTQANNWSNQQSARRRGVDAQIVELTNFRGDMQVRTVFQPQDSASIADLRLHWDGDRVMFTSLMPDRRWNVFEVKLDGSGFRPMLSTVEPELEFYDGTYLPDGRVIANSNIGYQGVPCVNGSDPVGNMVLYDQRNSNLRRLTFDQDANWNPTIMHNGRVMYTRWEYTDLTHYYSRIVMHMNPDGTENKALWGSGSMFPNSTFDVQPLPGHSSAFVGIISGHHGVARSGRLLLFDPIQARRGVEGVMQEIPHRNLPINGEVKDYLVDGVWPQFIKPMPLDDKYFLVAAKLSPTDLWGLYLVDIFDNVTPIIKTEGEGFISPILVRKVTTPPVIPDRVRLTERDATVFIQDIYEGEGLPGVPRGQVKELRIFAYEYAYLHSPSDHTAQGIQSGWDIKRLLGTVPVEEDGSAIFKIPANTPISMQPLDESGAAIQWMRSWLTAMPGEIVSCVGCHEDQNQIVIPRRTIASLRQPHELKVPEGGVRSFTFDLEVQPILDRACIACHTGEGSAFDLRGGTKNPHRGFGTSYLNLHPFVRRQGPEAGIQVLYPYEYHANTSELIRMLKVGHYGVELTDTEWRSLYNWIDFNAPDKGTFEATRYAGFPYQGFDQIARRIELTNKYANNAGVDWQQEIADYATFLAAKGPITPVRPPRQAPVVPQNIRVEGWPFPASQIPSMVGNNTTKVVNLAPGIDLRMVYIPAGKFVMGSYNGLADTHPTFAAEVSKGFWMGEIEITNEQYNVLVPGHDSRYVDQFWKDHVHEGYPANLPHQPVIRVSYEEVMAFCRMLSEKTGLNFTLPTETQWEWAARAGSANEFWFGGLNTNFSWYENLADVQLRKMAVSGVDPQPMSPNNQWFPFFDFIPKAEYVDDGNMLQVASNTYLANPFGLFGMHGNIAEWTRSYYLPYPLNNPNATGELKVVRGGSYIERPKYSTSAARKAYHPWQKVFNVGFRVIIEE